MVQEGEEAEMAGEERPERIVVSVRLRPVNAREAERGDGSDWECAGPTTLTFRGAVPERAMFPASYSYGSYAAAAAECNCKPLSRSPSRRGFQTGCSAMSAARGRCTTKAPGRSPCQCSVESTVTKKKRTNPLLVCNDELFVVFFVAMNSLARICSDIAAASIFAYGQTSSGKTYTMVGITEYSMSDIYDYIEKVINRVD